MSPQKPRAVQPVPSPRLIPAGASTGHTAPDPGELEAGLEALTDEVRHRLTREPWYLTAPPAAAVPGAGCGTPGCEQCAPQPPVPPTAVGLVAAALAALSRIGGAAKTVLGVWR